MYYRSQLYFHLIIAYSLIVLLGGCSNLSGKFNDTENVNLSPFAEQVTVMIGQLNYAFEKDRALYAKPYFSLDMPELKRLLALEKKTTSSLRAMVNYSMLIVSLSESANPELEKSNQLADILTNLREINRQQNDLHFNLSDQKVTAIIDDLRKQKTLLAGLRAVQPLINESARYTSEILDKLKIAENDLAYRIDDEIDNKNIHLTNLIATMNYKQIALIQAFQDLSDYENGDLNALQSLKKSSAIRRKSLIQKNTLSISQIEKLEQHLLSRLKTLKAMFTQIQPDYKRYIKAQQELDKLATEHDKEIRKIRLFIIAWARAHQRMASGKVSPAKWFDFRKTPGLLFKLL